MSINIILDNFNNVCYPGQQLSGRLECTFNNEKKLRAILIKLRGYAKCQWTENESYYDNREKIHMDRPIYYYSEEVCLARNYNLVESTSESFRLPAGKHVYQFSCALPTQMPSSFEGSYGTIRYYIKGVVDRPWKFNYKTEVPLQVNSVMDLSLPSPMAVSDDKEMLSCCCTDSGRLTFKLSMPTTRFVRGQDINVVGYVQNMTNVSAECIKLKVTAFYKFTCRDPRTSHKYDSFTIVKCVDSGVGAHGEKSWTSFLTLPLNRTYPNLNSCNIISASYCLEGKVVLPFPHKNLKIDIPISIGSAALHDVIAVRAGFSLPEISNNIPLVNYPVIENSPERIAIVDPPPYLPRSEGPSYSAGSTLQFSPNAPPAEQTIANLPPPYATLSESLIPLHPFENGGPMELRLNNAEASAPPPAYEETLPAKKEISRT